MKVKELDFGDYEPPYDKYIKRCVFNSIEYDSKYKKVLYDMIHKSESVEQFIDNYLSNDEFANRQAYAVLSERCRPAAHWYRIRESLGDDSLKIISDAGGVKIGNDGFSTIISNGYGDGVTRCAIKDKKWNHCFLGFVTSITGNDINIYDYDCGNNPIKKLDPGRYGIYSGNGFVVFVKWD